MKKLKSCLLVVFIFFSVTVQGNELSEIELYLDELLSFQLHFNEQEVRLKSTIDKLSQELKLAPDNPYLWYLKGRSSLALVYVLDTQDSQYQAVRARVADEFTKALELNRDKPSLPARVLAEIFSFATVSSVEVEATRQYIDLNQSPEWLKEKEHLELLQDRVVSGLIKQNKFEEALKELDRIDVLFPENAEGPNGNNAWRKFYDKEIEKQKEKLKAESEKETVVEKKEEPAPVAPQPAEEQPQPDVTPQPLEPEPTPIPQVKSVLKPTPTVENELMDYRWLGLLLLTALILIGLLWRRSR